MHQVFTHAFVFSLTIAMFAISTHAVKAVAQEFRVETQVYLGDNEQPVTQNLTLFSNRTIYDFQMSNDAQPTPIEIVIYDMRDRSFVIIDPVRNKRIKLQQEQLLKMLEGLRQETNQNEKSKFLMEPFEEHFDTATNWVTLSNSKIRYRYTGKQPKNVAILPVYFEFLDQYTRLQASDPTKLPPFARLALNQSIKKFGWFTDEINVTIEKNKLFNKQINLKSKHTMIQKLSKQDRTRIDKAKSSWMKSKLVNISAYRGLTAAEASTQTKGTTEKKETKTSKK